MLASVVVLAVTVTAGALRRRWPGAIGFANLSDLAVRAQHYEDAETYARAALTIDPAFPVAHNELAVALEAQGDLRRREALPHLETAARLDPADPDVQHDLRTVCEKLRESR